MYRSDESSTIIITSPIMYDSQAALLSIRAPRRARLILTQVRFPFFRLHDDVVIIERKEDRSAASNRSLPYFDLWPFNRYSNLETRERGAAESPSCRGHAAKRTTACFDADESSK